MVRIVGVDRKLDENETNLNESFSVVEKKLGLGAVYDTGAEMQ